MKHLTLTLIIMTSLNSSWAIAHGEHKHKPLTWEELPKICQTHFQRTQACYSKIDESVAQFHRGNTEMLRQSLPAATVEQRERMCQIAEDSFAAKAQAMRCE